MDTNYSQSTVPFTPAQQLRAAHDEMSRSRQIFYTSMVIFTGCLVGCIFAGIWQTKAMHNYHIVPNSGLPFGSFANGIWSSHHWKSIATLSGIGIAGASIGMFVSGGFAISYFESAFPDSQTRIVDHKHVPAQSPPMHWDLSANCPSINGD